MELKIARIEARSSERENMMADPDFFKGGSAETTKAVQEHQKILVEIPRSYEDWERLEEQIKQMEIKLEASR